MHISIHTPTKGVTILEEGNPIILIISIHTPTKGVTSGSSNNKDDEDEISIHTPTKGVTSTLCGRTLQGVFQSTLPRRE